MSIRHGKKFYYQILLDPNRSELFRELANKKGLRATGLIRELVYEELEKTTPKHIYQMALAKDKAIWRESISNRIYSRKNNKKNTS